MHIPWLQYKAILELMPIACIDVAICHQGTVLLVKRTDAPAKDQWWVPGGRVLKGEMIRDAAARKAREEVGLECHVGAIIHTAETLFPDGPGDVPVHSINSCFMLFPKDREPVVRLDGHQATFAWFDHIPPGLHPYVRCCLANAGLTAADADPPQSLTFRHPP